MTLECDVEMRESCAAEEKESTCDEVKHCAETYISLKSNTAYTIYSCETHFEFSFVTDQLDACA